MTHLEIARRRMINQRLARSSTYTPAEITGWLGAVQAQEYPGAKWALALRCGQPFTDTDLQAAVDAGHILRTHVLRPTWHFITPRDARWMLALTGPRVIRGLASRYRQLELDEATFTRAHDVLRDALKDGKILNRAQLKETLIAAGIDAARQDRFGHILTQAELSGLIISGAWDGKQNTYQLLDNIDPSPPPFDRDWALAELARRYFTSHGPAALKDFGWWSGLTLADARAGIAAAGESLLREEIDGTDYYGPPEGPHSRRTDLPVDLPVHLLPAFDEYVVAYADRSAVFDPANTPRMRMAGGVLDNVLLVDGLVAGSWKRAVTKDGLTITVETLEPISNAARDGLEEAARRYGAFHQTPTTLQVI